MQTIFKDWGFSRIFRLVAGLGILGYGYMELDWALIIFGSIIAIMGVTNSGCGPFSNSCEIEEKPGKPSSKE
ncbi:MAG: hypothetical protein ABFS32_02935 [Bacteroidota bacterium]